MPTTEIHHQRLYQRFREELQRDEIYVPLAIVQRRIPKPQPGNQQEEKKRTEKLISIAEERFFEDVLGKGKGNESRAKNCHYWRTWFR